MSKVHIGRQGFLTKNALPNVSRPSEISLNLNALLNANQTTDNISNTNVVDSSTYNWTINYQAGMPSQTQATPFTAGTGGSMFFNGRSDYINVSNPSNNAAFIFGSGDFTIEFWFFSPAVAGGINQILYDGRAATNNGNQITPLIVISGTNIVYIVSNITRITSGAIAANTWYHVALVRIGGTTRLYINGTQSGSSYTDGNNYVCGADRPAIGVLGFGFTIDQWVTQTTNLAFRGFMSNIRVVKNVGVYTGNFTIPTGPLAATQSAGTNIAAITGTQTSLLLNFENNFRVFDSSTANPKGLAPCGINFAPIGGQVNFHPYSSSGKYGSYWNDGVYGFIDSLSSADWAFGTGNFTMECWFYGPAAAGSWRGVLLSTWAGTSTASNIAFVFSFSLAGKLQFVSVTGGSTFTVTETSTVIQPNQWYHAAVVRDGNNFRIYVNGVQDANVFTTSASMNSPTVPLKICGYQELPVVANGLLGLGTQFNDGPFSGYITGIRIVKGTAVYTGNFTPPSIQPVDVDGASSAASYPSTTNVNTSFSSNNTKLLCKFDRWTIQDNDTLPRPIYVLGTAQTSTTQAKFGAGSLTGGSSLSTTSNVYLSQGINFGTGDFTIACWLYANAWNATNNQNPICTIGMQNSNTSTSNTYYIYITNAGAVSIERFGSTTTTIGSITPGSYTNTWFYFTLVRRSGTTTCYIDGTSIGSTSALSGLTVGNQSGIVLGKYLYGAVGTGTYTMWNGYIDDFYAGAAAVYSANFIPPSTQTTDPITFNGTITNNTYGLIQKYN